MAGTMLESVEETLVYEITLGIREESEELDPDELKETVLAHLDAAQRDGKVLIIRLFVR